MYSINLCTYLLTDSDKRQKQHCTRHTWVISRVCAHTNSSSFIHAASQLTFSLSSLRVACVRVCLQNCSLHSDSAESPTLAPSSGSHEWSISRLLTPHPPLCLSFVSLHYVTQYCGRLSSSLIGCLLSSQKDTEEGWARWRVVVSTLWVHVHIYIHMYIYTYVHMYKRKYVGHGLHRTHCQCFSLLASFI